MKFPREKKITGRISSITNAFVHSIIPSHEPTDEEMEEALAVLDISPDKFECVYCGTPSTDWDHLHPLVKNKRPTGYINELRNLVPACGPCNQSKGAQPWKDWMLGTARNSPSSRGIADVQKRVETIEGYVKWGNPTPLPLEELAGVKDWAAHWENHQQIVELMKDAQIHAASVRINIENKLP